MRPRQLDLSAEQRAELEQTREQDRRPYLRERAAALLKIADGQSAHAVARHGLLRARTPETVYDWLNRYERHGLAGLIQHPRGWRGFSPSAGRTTFSSRAPSA